MQSEVIQALSEIKDSLDALAQPRPIDWLAIMISFLSMAVSGVAVWFAVQIPKKIAKEQNRIALFEKRYEMYNLLYKWKYLAEQIIAYAETNKDARSMFSVLYGNYDSDFQVITDQVLSMYRETVCELYKLYLLFPINNDCHDKLIAFIKLIDMILIGENIAQHKKELEELIEAPEIKCVFETMQYELNVSK